ncbi:MAG TPA: carboxymuconolactone decarboxylase family protein [Magnetospirillaceae bacterium]|nr:carboxymuconolactone decarboxylase family protein [Magnetospirillaceae bacterium]
MTQRLDHLTSTPGGMKALGGVHGYLTQTDLPKQLIDLVFLRTSQLNGCAYCIDMHSRDLLKSGLSVDKLVLVPAWREAGALFTAQEQAALAWTESVTLVAETGIPDADFATVRAQFSEKDVADLTIAIGLMNAYNRIGVGFRLTPGAAK